MTAVPQLVWPEDGAGAPDVLAATQTVLGAHPWLAFVPNPRPFEKVLDQIGARLDARRVDVNNTVAFVVDGRQTREALRVFFETGAPEWAVLGFDTLPTDAMMTQALTAQDAKPATRSLLFDSNVLIALV